MNMIKTQRINSDILRVLTVAIQQKVRDGSLADVTILNVKTTADMGECKVFVAINGNESHQKAVLENLSAASGFLRNEIAQNVKMKQTPQLRFMLDKGRANAERVDELLKTIKG